MTLKWRPDPTCNKMDAVLFDMDGVLVDSVDLWTDVRREVLEEALGIRGFDVTRFVGMNVRDEHALLETEYDLDVSVDEYQEHIDSQSEIIYGERVELLRGVEDVFAAARSPPILLGIVSASDRHRVETVCERFDLDSMFDVVVGADDIDGLSKPAPDLYEHAIERLAVSPSETVVVEDSHHGVEAAKRAGCYCLQYVHDLVQPDVRADERYYAQSSLCARLVELCDEA